MSGTNKSVASIQHPVSDVSAAASFYSEALGLTTKFIDGARYAAMDAGGTTFALVSQEEDLTHGAPTTAFRVPDVSATLEKVVSAGGSVVRPPTEGPHEVRALVRDPWGVIVIIYQPR